MRNLNKVMRIASKEGQPWREALYDFLLNCRIAKHIYTDVCPAEALFHRKIQEKVPNINHGVNLKALQNMQTHDFQVKQKMKIYHDTKLHASESQVRVGDYVIVQQPKQNKLTRRYDPSPYRVAKQKGTKITAGRPGQSITWNIQHFKLLSIDIYLQTF